MNLSYSNSLPKQYKHIDATQIFRTSSGSNQHSSYPKPVSIKLCWLSDV